MMLISKIISGGQTGVDRGALEAAFDCGFPYGGLVPKGRLAEDGVIPSKFTALVESTRKDYLYRTEQNVIGSDATLILSRTRELSGGTKKTAAFCEKHGRPYFIDNPDSPNETDRGLEVLYWLEAAFDGRDDIVLNVAGPRESKCCGIQEATKAFIIRLITDIGFGGAQ